MQAEMMSTIFDAVRSNGCSAGFWDWKAVETQDRTEYVHGLGSMCMSTATGTFLSALWAIERAVVEVGA